MLRFLMFFLYDQITIQNSTTSVFHCHLYAYVDRGAGASILRMNKLSSSYYFYDRTRIAPDIW